MKVSSKGSALVGLGDQRQQRSRGSQVDLVAPARRRRRGARQALQRSRAPSSVSPLHGVDHQQGADRRPPRRAQAAATMARSSRRARREDAGRVDEARSGPLAIASRRRARARARGLHLGRDDRDLGADQRGSPGSTCRRWARRPRRRSRSACAGSSRSAHAPRRSPQCRQQAWRRLLGRALGAAGAAHGRRPVDLDLDDELRRVGRPLAARSRR